MGCAHVCINRTEVVISTVFSLNLVLSKKNCIKIKKMIFQSADTGSATFIHLGSIN